MKCVPVAKGIYVFLINVPPEWRESLLHIVMNMLQCMYQVPLKWEQHGDTIQWCEMSIPGGSDLRLLRKGIVLSLDDVDPSQSEWDRWLPASAPNAGKVMKGQMPALTQKSLWGALTWRDVHDNLRSLFWGLGFVAYSTAWWKPAANRFFNSQGLRERFLEALVDAWYKQGRDVGALHRGQAAGQAAAEE